MSQVFIWQRYVWTFEWFKCWPLPDAYSLSLYHSGHRNPWHYSDQPECCETIKNTVFVSVGHWVHIPEFCNLHRTRCCWIGMGCRKIAMGFCKHLETSSLSPSLALQQWQWQERCQFLCKHNKLQCKLTTFSQWEKLLVLSSIWLYLMLLAGRQSLQFSNNFIHWCALAKVFQHC